MIAAMDDAVRCPGCNASLELPSAVAGQTVQCPRCENVFEPHRPGSPLAASVVVPPSYTGESDEEVLHDQRPICSPDPFSGKWKAILAVCLLGICMISFGVQSYINFKEAQLAKEGWHVPFRQEADGGRPNELHNFAFRSYG